MVASTYAASYFPKMKTFAEMLSTRAKNGLAGAFGGPDILYHPERIAAGRERLTLARNIGAVPLGEIASNLYKYGFINDIDNWLRG